jgi:hypothetical protein
MNSKSAVRPRAVGVIARHQHGLRAQGLARVEQGVPGVQVKRLADANDFEVEHLHPRVTLNGQGLAHQGGVVQEGLVRSTWGIGHQAQTHGLIARVVGHGQGFGHAAPVGAEVGQRQQSVHGHHCKGEVARGMAMVECMWVVR